MTVKLTRALPAQAPLIQNLMQLYTHDFSEFWAKSSRGDLSSDGRFEDYPLDEYWKNPSWEASLIYSDNVLAGFALVNDHAHSGKPINRNVGEFFVLRKHRSQSVGKIAAQLMFASHPGSWEVAVARKNLRAIAFWLRLIENSSEVSNTEEMDMDNEHWNGPIFRFEWRHS